MQYAVITGASAGIGRAIAEKLLAEGCAVAVCARNGERLQETVNEWCGTYKGALIKWMAADMSTADGVNAFAGLVAGSFPQVNILVNNAGDYKPGLIAVEPEGQLESMMSTNLYAPYRLARKLLPMMKAHASGHIFNICSVASLKGYKNIGSYSITKYALLGLTDNLREELRDDGIKVTAICPGATWTSSWDGSGVATERIMEAADIASMLWAAYKLSPQAAPETIVMRPVKGDL